MKSRVHPKYKTKYRVGNWPEYDRGLVQRGDITIWLSPEAIATWEPQSVGKRGGQWKYSDVAIETALTYPPRLRVPERVEEHGSVPVSVRDGRPLAPRKPRSRGRQATPEFWTPRRRGGR